TSKFRLYREQLVEILLEFLQPFKDFESAEPCNQVLDIEIVVFLDSFIDRIEITDKNENEENTVTELILCNDNAIKENVNAIIDENIQIPNTEKWINSVDKNFNALRRMVNDCKRFNRQQKFPNTWEGLKKLQKNDSPFQTDTDDNMDTINYNQDKFIDEWLNYANHEVPFSAISTQNPSLTKFPLPYWHTMLHVAPNLSEFARCLLSIPPNSETSEW
ncbi:15919_t:CDS:2, partial [Gigaspora margarita]